MVHKLVEIELFSCYKLSQNYSNGVLTTEFSVSFLIKVIAICWLLPYDHDDDDNVDDDFTYVSTLEMDNALYTLHKYIYTRSMHGKLCICYVSYSQSDSFLIFYSFIFNVASKKESPISIKMSSEDISSYFLKNIKTGNHQSEIFLYFACTQLSLTQMREGEEPKLKPSNRKKRRKIVVECEESEERKKTNKEVKCHRIVWLSEATLSK